MSNESQRQRILVVDDAPENIRVLGETLRCHYKVSFASNGPEAIAMARSDNAPDLILLDIMMPEMDGYEVCRRLKADKGTQDIPVIFVTAKSEEESETEGLELGAVDYITKPFSPARVLARVRVHLEQKLAKEALRESEERVRAIFRASPDPVVVYDSQGQPRFMNPAFTRVFGWSLDELRGRNIPFVPEDQKEATAATIRALYESGEPLTLETQRLTKEGNTLDILISAAVIQEHQGQPTGLVVNLTDITHTKKLQDQLQRAQKMGAIGTLAGGIAHDFNNLLSVILGNISMAKEDLTPGHGTYPLLSDAEEASIRTKELTHQLITFSRGGAPIRKRGAITGLLKGATTLALAGSNVSYDFSLAENLWPVEHDETQMKHVVTNLITNACEPCPRVEQSR